MMHWILILTGCRSDLPRLAPGYDFMRPTEDVRSDGAEAADLYDGRRSVAEIRHTCVEHRTFLGDRPQALQMLLEIKPDASISYRDALMACVIAGSMSKMQFENTVCVASSLFLCLT